MKHTEFQRGAIAAAANADQFNGTSSHPYRLGDCILAKMNIGTRKPRRNPGRKSTGDAWVVGFVTALAEMHRRLLRGNDSASVRAVAAGAGVTLSAARAARANPYDVKELKKAGVR